MLAAARASPGYLMSSTTMQQSFDLVEKAVDHMQYAVMPSADMTTGSSVLKLAYNRFPHFYRIDAADDTGRVQNISGDNGMAHSIDVMENGSRRTETSFQKRSNPSTSIGCCSTWPS